MNPEFVKAVENFPWESDVQKKGYLNYVQYLRKFGFEPKLPVDYLAVFMIQKDHESNEYWRELVGTQVSMLQKEISGLQNLFRGQQEQLDSLTRTVNAMMSDLLPKP